MRLIVFLPVRESRISLPTTADYRRQAPKKRSDSFGLLPRSGIHDRTAKAASRLPKKA